MQGINHIIQKKKNTSIKNNKDSAQINKTIIGILINQILFINQIFSNHIHETNKRDKQDITQRHLAKTFNHKILQIHKFINQLKCKMKSHYHIVYNNMK